MRMKRMSALLLVAGLSLTAMACGKQDGEGDKKGAVDEPINLVFFTDTGMPEQEFEERIGSKVKKKFPHITPVYNKVGKGFTMEELVAAGSAIDVVWSEDFGKLKEMNMQFDMSELVAKHKFDLKAFDSDVVNVAKQFSDGKLYGVPGSFVEGFLMFYNKDLFNKFGVPYPKDGLTWDETYELAKRLTRTDGGETYQGLTFVPNNMMLNNQLSIGPLHPKEDKATVNTDGWKSLFENFRRFVELPNASVLPVGDFSKGKVAMIVNSHPPIVSYQKANPDLQWDVVSLPVLKERPKTGFKPASLSLFVTQTSKHKDEAFETVAFLVSEDVQLTMAKKGLGTPLTSTAVKKATGQDLPEWKGKNVNALYYLEDAPPTEPRAAQLVNVGVNFEKAFVDMVKNKTDVNTALRLFEEQVNQAIAAEKAKTGK